jgi:hypothetical protein
MYMRWGLTRVLASRLHTAPPSAPCADAGACPAAVAPACAEGSLGHAGLAAGAAAGLPSRPTSVAG